MAHPFFDSLEWPASRAEAQAFERALLAAFKTPAAIDDVYQRAAPGLEALNLGQKPRFLWNEALGNLMVSGQLRAFCDMLLASGPQSPVFRAAVEAVIAARSAVDRRVVAGGVLVVDRASLREQIGLLLARDSPVAVLLVRGGPKSGKSHANYLFEAAAGEVGAKAVYVGRDIVFTLGDVIRELFAMVGGVPRKIAKDLDSGSMATTTEAWYQLVCSELLAAANHHDVRLWIAADDLGTDEQGEPLIDDAILQFFNQFALAMRASQYKARFRLMLIHYPPATPTRWPTVIWRADTVAIEDIREDALLDFLRSWSEERGKVIVEEQLATLTAELLTSLDAPVVGPEAEKPKLQRVYDLLDAMTRRLAQA